MGKIVRHTQEELAAMEAKSKSKTDWTKVDALSDEQLTQNALEDADNPPLTDAELAQARPASEVLHEVVGPELANEMLKKRGRPKKESTKQQITLRLSPEVIEFFRSTGQGWQSRIDEVLRDSLKKGSTRKAA